MKQRRKRGSSGFAMLHMLPLLLASFLLTVSTLLLWQQSQQALQRQERLTETWNVAQAYTQPSADAEAHDQLLRTHQLEVHELQAPLQGTEGVLREFELRDKTSQRVLVNCFQYKPTT